MMERVSSVSKAERTSGGVNKEKQIQESIVRKLERQTTTMARDATLPELATIPESFSGEEAKNTGRLGRRWIILSAIVLVAVGALLCVTFLALPSRSSKTSQIVSSENANVEEESPEDSEADTEDSEADTGIFFSNDESEVPASNDEVEDCTRFLFMDIDTDLLTRDALGFDDDGVEDEEAEEEEEVFSTNSINDEGSDATESSSEKRRRCENLVRRLSQRED